MLLKPTILREAETAGALDQKRLYGLGLEHVRRFSRRSWTDHNAHDPGITTLELLCYALTDLAYRSRFSLEDLLAAPDNAANMAAQFFTPREILPNRALTERDYRKLLIDLPDVKNAWLYQAVRTLYADSARSQLFEADPGRPSVQAVSIRGQYGVRVEYQESITTAEQRAAVRAAVEKRLQANRNLCEDFVEYAEVERAPFALCGELELESDADVVEVAAQIRFQVASHLAPAVRSRTLAQMLSPSALGGLGRSVEQVFDGPALDHGFIDDDELDAAALREQLYLSDVISILMDITGVRAVREATLNQLVHDAITDTWRALAPLDVWQVPVPEGKQSELRHLRVVFYKRGLPVQADSAKVEARLAQLQSSAQLSNEGLTAEDLPLPLGRPRNTSQYYSFQNHFPEVYGISAQGLPTNADDERRAQALQFKGYLLFFDQILANYCAQLAQLRLLFRRNFAQDFASDPAALRTYFAQRVESFREFESVYAAGVDTQQLSQLLESDAQAVERRNQILDHLLARVGEDFHEVANVLRSVFDVSELSLARTKSEFLTDYPALGAERALAWNKSLRAPADLWNSFNVSGFERRLARSLGIANYSRRNLGAVSYQLYAELDPTPGDEFRFRLKHPVSGKILLSGTKHYVTPEAARVELEQAIRRAQLPEGYQRKLAVDGLHYFNIVDTDGDILAQRKQRFQSLEQMNAEIDALQQHLIEFYSGEGLYVIENLLLLPDAAMAPDTQPLLPICTDPGCADCSDSDPYSYRLHIVLPAYAGRFQNIDFRRFVESTIRREVPAHILPKICWANEADMAALEQAYRDWIPLRAGVTDVDREQKVQRLIDALFATKTVYPTQRLHDCSDSENQPPFVLGRTALGSEEPNV